MRGKPVVLQDYEIEITFDPDTGEVESTVTGIEGPTCAGILDFIKQFASVVLEEGCTPDFEKNGPVQTGPTRQTVR